MHNRCYGNGYRSQVPRVVDHEQRRQELLDATWEVVGGEGIEATTLRRIAERAGCTTGLVTHYFESKEEVLVAALRRVHAAAGERMVKELQNRPGLAGLRAVLLEALPLDEVRQVEWKVWIAFWGNASTSSELQLEQHRRYTEWRALLTGALLKSKRNGELTGDLNIARLVDQIVSLIDGLGLQAILDPDHLPPRRLRALLDDSLTKLMH